MKLSRSGHLGGLALVGVLALAACASDATTRSGSGTTPGGVGAPDASVAVTGSVNGEGSSAQKNAIDEAIALFTQANPGAQVTYNPTGSGAGIRQFNAGQVDWAGSDSALKKDPGEGSSTSEVAAAKKRCQGNDPWNLPMIAGPIAIAYNLQGVDELVLTPAVASRIFLGKITTWNDPAIEKLNSGASLPATKISVFFRSDESGTTENFQTYLARAAASDWTGKPSKTWPGKVGQGAAKSSGVAQRVKDTPGGVTYVEWSNAKDLSLGVARIDNGGGAVELTGETAGKAVAAAKPDGEGNDLRLKIDYATKEAGVYPVVLVTYEIACSKGLDAGRTTVLKAFLKHVASADVQESFEGIGYAPLPAEVLTKVNTAIDAIS